MLLAIPATVFLVKEQQDQRTLAVPNTNLTFSPDSETASVGDQVSFDIFISPGNNQVGFIKLAIKFDPTILSTTEEGFELDPLSNLSILEGPVVGTDDIIITSVISDVTKIIQTNTKIGTITFDVNAPSDLPTQISFDSSQIQISSIAAPDSIEENVFSNGTPASITILEEGEPELSPEPTATPSATPTPTLSEEQPEASATATPTPTTIGGVANVLPVCSTLFTDLGTSGTAPYTLIFTAEGSDSDGTIKTVSFDFGDSTVENITEGGGIGTSSLSIQKTHTYSAAGTYSATVTITDELDGTSSTASCSLQIVISDGSGGSISSTPTPTIADPGPREAIVGVGVLGGILFLVGTLLFFAL